jgi:hypothetical protein
VSRPLTLTTPLLSSVSGLVSTSKSLVIVTLIMEAIRSSERLFLQEPHGVASQKPVLFIATSHLSGWGNSLFRRFTEVANLFLSK